MKNFASKFDFIPLMPDAVAVFNLAANTAQAMDYPTAVDLVRVTFASSAGAAQSGVFSGYTTGAAWATSHTATPGSSIADSLVAAGDHLIFQRPRASTGFSVISATSGVCHVEMWSRAGTTS